MRAVMPSVLPEVIALRKQTGADRYDEMWEGVLHMPPMPNRYHQNLVWSMETYLRFNWARPQQGRVYHEVNLASIGGWPNDYRIPDLLLLKPERFAIDHNEYFEGPPNVVVEIHSPGDETYEKLSFYAELGVPEVCVIHRDTGEPEIHVLRRHKYRKLRLAANGWLRSRETGIELRQGKSGKLAIRLAGDESTRQDLPED
jgi:Uma2 family endonuclease